MDKELKGTAYHEAAHAVAAYAQGKRFKKVSIVPDTEDNTSGYCEFKLLQNFRPDIEVNAGTRNRLEKEIVICFAGYVAEKRIIKKTPKGFESDFVDAGSLASHMTSSIRETEAYLKWLYERANNLITLPWHWTAIKALAKALLEDKEIKYSQAQKIIQEAIDKNTDCHQAATFGSTPTP